MLVDLVYPYACIALVLIIISFQDTTSRFVLGADPVMIDAAEAAWLWAGRLLASRLSPHPHEAPQRRSRKEQTTNSSAEDYSPRCLLIRKVEHQSAIWFSIVVLWDYGWGVVPRKIHVELPPLIHQQVDGVEVKSYEKIIEEREFPVRFSGAF